MRELEILVLWHVTNDIVNKPESLVIDATGANIQFFQKPINAEEVRNMFSTPDFARQQTNDTHIRTTNATVIETTEP